VPSGITAGVLLRSINKVGGSGPEVPGKSAFYEQVTGVKVSLLFFHGIFVFAGVGCGCTASLLSAGFLFARWVSCLEASSVPVGVREESDAAIYRSVSEDLTPCSLIETRGRRHRWSHLRISSCRCVERHVGFLRYPDAVKQNSKLPGHHDSSSSRMAAAACAQA